MPGDILILHMCTLNDSHICFLKYELNRIFCHFGPFYTIPEILHVTNFYFSFIHFIHFLPFHAQKTKIKKWNNTLGNITILQMCTKNYDHVIYGSYDMVRHGRTDGQKKWYIEMWVPHMKALSSFPNYSYPSKNG